MGGLPLPRLSICLVPKGTPASLLVPITRGSEPDTFPFPSPNRRGTRTVPSPFRTRSGLPRQRTRVRNERVDRTVGGVSSNERTHQVASSKAIPRRARAKHAHVRDDRWLARASKASRRPRGTEVRRDTSLLRTIGGDETYVDVDQKCTWKARRSSPKGRRQGGYRPKKVVLHSIP